MVIRNDRVIGYRLPDGKVVCLKHRYRDDEAARAALVGIWSRATHDHVPVRSYVCEFCAGVHLTHQRRRA